MFCDCKILPNKIDYFSIGNERIGFEISVLPREILSRIGFFVATGATGKKDAFCWGSVSVLTHLLFHRDNLPKILADAQKADDLLLQVWTKLPNCCFPEHIEHDGYGGSWGGGRPQTANEIKLWFESFITDIQKKQITTLYLTKLDLTGLPPELVSLSMLSWVDLSRNCLSSIPVVISKCQKLSTLILDHNNITDIPNWLEECPSLWWVQVLDNPVSKKGNASFSEKLRRIVILE